MRGLDHKVAVVHDAVGGRADEAARLFTAEGAGAMVTEERSIKG